MNTPELIVLIGLPGVGKSTWISNYLKDKTEEYIIVSSDNYITKWAEEKGGTYRDYFNEFVVAAGKKSREDFFKAVKDTKNIIIDYTNMTEKRRKMWLDNTKEYNRIAVVWSLSPQTHDARIKSREEKEGYLKVPSFVMDQMAKSYVAPSKKEGFDKIIYIKD